MAKKQSREGRTQVDLDAEMARKARIVAATLEVSLPDYVNNRLRAIIEEDYARAVTHLHRQAQKKGPAEKLVLDAFTMAQDEAKR